MEAGRWWAGFGALVSLPYFGKSKTELKEGGGGRGEFCKSKIELKGGGGGMTHFFRKIMVF